MARNTYVFAGPAGSEALLMKVIETALGHSFVREPGTDPYLCDGSISVYVSGHDFDDDDIDRPSGLALQLRTGFPHVAEIRDVDRDVDRQMSVAARIFAAIKDDGRLAAVWVDDMQRVMDVAGVGVDRAG